jgi:hypothetical protein
MHLIVARVKSTVYRGREKRENKAPTQYYACVLAHPFSTRFTVMRGEHIKKFRKLQVFGRPDFYVM